MQWTRIALPLAVASGLLAAAAAPAGAAKMVVKGAPAAGPAKYDRLEVWTYGASKANAVLVLVPGTSGGAGSITPVAKDIAKRVRRLQVWVVDRREQAFEDQSVYRTGSLTEIHDYYLGGNYDKPGAVPFAADWGLATQTRDLRRVVQRASDGGRRQVLLGGHSRGASQALAYAAWDFGGRGGFKDLAGLVLIDGGLLGFLGDGAKQPYTRETAREAVAEIRDQPFNDPLGLGLPEIAQVLSQAIAVYARSEPNAPSQMQQEPIIPDSFKPEFPVTNEAFLGFSFDADYSRDAGTRTNSGQFAATGDPRPWVSGQQTPIGRVATAAAGTAPDWSEWYYPERLIIDIAAAEPMRRDPASDELGLRLFHTRKVDTPLYAFETSLVPGRVLGGARRLIQRSRISRRRLVKDHAMSHLDPVLAASDENTFLKTVVPFLRDVAGR